MFSKKEFVVIIMQQRELLSTLHSMAFDYKSLKMKSVFNCSLRAIHTHMSH